MAERDAKGHWKKGQSANPGGRGKTPEEVRTALMLAAPDAVKRLHKLLDHKDVRVVLAAAELILTRVLGKPREEADPGDGTRSPDESRVVVRFVPLGQARAGHRPGEVDDDGG